MEWNISVVWLYKLSCIMRSFELLATTEFATQAHILYKVAFVFNGNTQRKKRPL